MIAALLHECKKYSYKSPVSVFENSSLALKRHKRLNALPAL